MKKLLKLTLVSLCTLLLAANAGAQTIQLKNLDNRPMEARQGASWGVPFAKGTISAGQTFTLTDEAGKALPLQSWPLAYWPDGSMKWVGFATIADDGLDNLTLTANPVVKAKKGAPAPAPEVGFARETAEGIYVNTGSLECLFPAEGSSVIKNLSIDGTVIASEGHLVTLLEKRKEKDGITTVSQEDFLSKIEKVTLMQNNPFRVAVKIEGMHSSGKREWLPFALYCVMYKDMPTMSITHSFVFDSDGQEDFIKGMGITFTMPFREEAHNRHARFAGDGANGAGFWCQPVRLLPGYRPSAGRFFVDNYEEYFYNAKEMPDLAEMSESERKAALTCPVWGDMRLVQSNSNGFSVDKRTTENSSWVHVTEGKRSMGGALLGDTSGSMFLGIKDFWQSYPASFQIDNAGEKEGTFTAWLWAPDGQPMDMRHYDTVAHDLRINYEDWKPGWDSPYGVGHRSTIELRLFNNIPSNDELWAVAEAVQKPVQYTCTPEYYYSVKAFGDYWNLPDMNNPVFAAVEKELDRTLDYYADQIEERYWYGFWHYGDIMHNYDYTRHNWRYDIGGWAWNNTELSPNVLLWTSFLRTGREDVWVMAEAMSKHSSEVDVHHIGEFAPLGSRHNVTHWGDGAKQPRIENASMKRFMYYLTGGDELTGDRMRQQLKAEEAYDYVLRICTRNPAQGTYLATGIGDWCYYAANWLVEWERTGNPYWGERLMNSMKDIVALGGSTGRLGFDYFDPETGRLLVYLNEKQPEPVQGADPRFMMRRATVFADKSEFVPAASLKPKKLESIIGYRIQSITNGGTFGTIFGAPEILADLKATVDYPEFWEATTNTFASMANTAGGSMTGPRMASWTAYNNKDAEMGALAWKNLLDNSTTAQQSDGTAIKRHAAGEKIATRGNLNAVEEPMFLGVSAGWQLHTPSTVQWMLNAIETMQWAKDYTPTEVPEAYTKSITE
ncbi:MAG: hypothetical protein IKM58_00320 [Tidjanibacter sp.]|nr:hypothetical protein [Tidjanibacter sp.]